MKVQSMASPVCQPGVPFPLGANHPPIVVQTVYVDTSENPEKKEGKPKKDFTSKKRRKGTKPQKNYSFRRRNPQSRRRLAVLYTGDPFDPRDSYDDMFPACSCCDSDYYDFQ